MRIEKNNRYFCIKLNEYMKRLDSFPAKPFVRWVGEKSQLIEQLDAQLPADFGNWENVTYIEPFVGSGAMLFYMLQRYPNIEHAVINDINPDLALETEGRRKDFFTAARERFNEKRLGPIENTTKFYFLNRTCFNDLYRVNKKDNIRDYATIYQLISNSANESA